MMKLKEVLMLSIKAVVIAHFKAPQDVGQLVYNGGPPPQNPAVNFQVTVVQGKLSASGKFIRFGETRGDEIIGWMHVDAIEVLEILGEQIGDEVVPFDVNPPLEMSDGVARLAS